MLTGPRKLLVTSLVGIALLGGLVFYVGLDKVAEAITRADLRFLLAAFVAYGLFFLARGMRWSLLLKPVRAPVSETTGLTAAGWLLNSIAPMKAGDVARAAVLARRRGAPFLTVFSTVAVERILDLLGLGIAAAVCLMLIPEVGLPGWFTLLLDLAWILPGVALAGLWVAVKWKAPFLDRTGRVLGAVRVPGRPRAKLVGFTEACINGAEGLLREPKALLTVVPLTIAMTFFQVAVFTCLFLAFIPEANVFRVAAGVPFFILSFAISVTPGNVGTYEGAFAAIYIALGFSADQVVPVAVLTHLFTFIIVGILGSLGIATQGISLGRAKEEALAIKAAESESESGPGPGPVPAVPAAPASAPTKEAPQ